MSTIKKLLGFIWIAMGPVAVYYLISTAWQQMQKQPSIDTTIQWSVFVIIFIPIAFGFTLFGWYAIKGEYHHLPQSSNELEEDS